MLGALLAAGALVFVLWPLLQSPRDVRGSTPTGRGHDRPSDASALRALREIEFDRATGKLSAADYEQLKDSYTSRAVAELRSQETDRAPASSGATAGADDPVEAMIRRARAAAPVCWQCTTSCPEPDAVYCSTCGAYLPGRCTHCDAPIRESGARFCTSCGWGLVRSN